MDGTNAAKFDATGETTADITRFGGTAMTVGQKAMTDSIPVVIASDQEISIGSVYTTQSGTSASGQVPNTAGETQSILSGVFEWSTLVLNFIPTPPIEFGGQFEVEGSIDNVNWTPLTGTLLAANPQQITQYLTANFQTVSARYNLAGFPYIRIHTLNAFTGLIEVQYALTTALGDETSFSKTELIDAAGASVTIPSVSQYTSGSAPTGNLYQSGIATVAGLNSGTEQTPDPVYVLPKSPIIGDTLLVAVVGSGNTGAPWTAADANYFQLLDTNNNWHTAADVYAPTFGTPTVSMVALFVVPVTQLDSEANLGFTVVNTNLTTGTFFPSTLTVLVHELQNVSIGSPLSVNYTTGSGGQTLGPWNTAPSGVFPVTILVTKTDTGGEPIIPSWAQQQYVNSAYWVASGSSFGQINYKSNTNEGYDLFWISAPIVSKGTAAMGYDYTGGEMHPLSVSSTGVLNVSVPEGSAFAVTQSGTWTIETTEASVGTNGAAVPTSATMMGASNPSGNLAPLQADSNGNLKVASLNAGANGGPIPAQAVYTGFNSGGEMVGVSATSPLPVTIQGSALSLGTVSLAGNTPNTTLDAAPNTTAPTHVLQVGGVYNTAPPDFVGGTTSPLQMDTNGNVKVNVAAGTITNPSAAATGSTVPADADYIGLNIGGDLVGQTGLALTNAKAAAVALVDSNGNQTGTAASPLSVFVSNETPQNPAVGITGEAVPASADYIGFLGSNQNLIGVSSSNPLPVSLTGSLGGTITSKTQDGTGNPI